MGDEMKYETRSVFLVKEYGHRGVLHKVFGSETEASNYAGKIGPEVVVDEWPVEFEIPEELK